MIDEPQWYNPLLYPEHNKDRQEDILWEMLDQGRITQKEYEDAINEEVIIAGDIFNQLLGDSRATERGA